MDSSLINFENYIAKTYYNQVVNYSYDIRSYATTANLNYIVFSRDKFRPNNLNKDTLNSRCIVYNSSNNEILLLLKKSVSIATFDNGKYEDPTKFIFFDKKSKNIYLEICKPTSENQRRIIIIKQLQDLTKIENYYDSAKAIQIIDNKLTVNKEFIEPRISIIDILGREIEYKTLITSPLSLEFKENLNTGLYFLNIIENNKSYNYKIIINK